MVLLISMLLASAPASLLQFDKKVHDFGTVSVSDGELKCSFTVTNTSDKASVILLANTNCNCIKVKWTRELIYPGKSGTIDVTYANDEGAKPFDKVVTVYIKDQKEPVLLHVRGVVKKDKK